MLFVVQIVQEFVLGKYDAEATAELHSNSPNISLQKDPRSQNAAQRFLPLLSALRLESRFGCRTYL